MNSKANFYLAFGPHPVMKIDTINRWIRLVLESSGVNMREIKNRNLNAATTSATMKNGISVSGRSIAVPIDKYAKPISNETAFTKLITEHRDGTQYTRRALKSNRATERRQHVDSRIIKLNETYQLKFDVNSAVYMSSFSD